MKIFLISGKSNSGKDQFAIYLREYYEGIGARVLDIHFGDLVKFFLKEYYHWDGQKDIAGRNMLQTLGTEIIRNKFADFWAKIVSQFIAATNLSWDYVIIPDWRFLNEYTTIKHYNKNIVTIRINKLDKDGNFIYNPNMTERERNHISECELDDVGCDYLINNNSTLEILRADANEIGVLERVKSMD